MDLVNFVIEFVPETITLLLWLLFLSASGLVYYWLKNKDNQSHEVPESLVRNYQESMVGNHHASESDYQSGSRNASILRSGELKNQMQVASVSDEQMNQLSHEISELKEMIKSRDKIIEQLEQKVPLNGSDSILETAEFDLLKNKNQELESKLKEYELLEDDLDTLRDLRIENKELKSQLNIEDTNISDISNEGESHEINGTNEDEDVFVVPGEESEGEETHLVEGSGEDSVNDENVRIEDKDFDRESVDLSGEAKSFGKVKVKGGSLFGRDNTPPKAGARSLGDSDIDDEIESIKNQKSDNLKKPQARDQEEKQALDDVENEILAELQDGISNEAQSESESNAPVENLVEEAADLGLGAPEPDNNLSDVESEIESALAEEAADNDEQFATADANPDEGDKSLGDYESSLEVDEAQEAVASADENIVELNPVEQPDHQSSKKNDSKPASDKSAEELLDEFEKMLG